MIETLLGSLLGIVSRTLPELFKWLDRKAERMHELAMQDRALEFEKLKGSQRMDEIGAQAQASWDTGALTALRESINAQGRQSGVRWIDALSCSVRPVITYLFFGLYALTKLAVFIGAYQLGSSWTDAVAWMWLPADMALWSGILNFWFLGRVFDKVR